MSSFCCCKFLEMIQFVLIYEFNFHVIHLQKDPYLAYSSFYKKIFYSCFFSQCTSHPTLNSKIGCFLRMLNWSWICPWFQRCSVLIVKAMTNASLHEYFKIMAFKWMFQICLMKIKLYEQTLLNGGSSMGIHNGQKVPETMIIKLISQNPLAYDYIKK